MSQPNITPLAGTTPEGDAAENHAVKPELVDGQDVCLATTFDDLLGEDDAPDETANDIIQAVRAWRVVTSSRGLE